MPSALLKSCSGDGGTCPELVAHGCCPKHSRQNEQRRGSARQRGYDGTWEKTRERFRRALLDAGIAPTCGARLPGATITNDSTCLAEGRFVDDGLHRLQFGTALHTDHIVPHEGDDRLRLDLLNLQLLCQPEHARKSQREQTR